MKILKIYYRCLSIISLILGITVILDTFILKQFLKNLMVKANTSSYSPYNSDGVLNLFAIFFLCIVIPIIGHYLICTLTKDNKNKDIDKHDM